MISSVAAIIFTVRDLDKACEFYGTVLGLKLTYKNVQSGWAEFSIGGVRFAIQQTEPFGNGQNPTISLQVDNLETTVAELQSRDVKFPSGGAIKTEFFGKQIDLQDPDGNKINLFEPPTR